MVVIAHLSDIHFGDACTRTLAHAKDALLSLRPDCVVVTGDITQAGRRREFKEAADWFARIPFPIVACPGNHDTPVFSPHERMFAPFRRFESMGLASQWTDEGGRVSVQSFNSARALQSRWDWSQGVHAPSEFGEAMARARAAAPHGWRLLACHHPPETPLDSRLQVSTRHGARTLAALRQAAKTLLLCGHVHRFTRTAIGEGEIITAPTLASSRARHDGCGFVVVRLNETRAAAERIRVNADTALVHAS